MEKLSNESLAANFTGKTDGLKPLTPFKKLIEQHGLLLNENSPFVKELNSKNNKFDLKNSIIVRYSLNFNEYEGSFLEINALNNSIRLDASRNTENCFELLSILTTPKIDKQQKNLSTNIAAATSSILKIPKKNSKI